MVTKGGRHEGMHDKAVWDVDVEAFRHILEEGGLSFVFVILMCYGYLWVCYVCIILEMRFLCYVSSMIVIFLAY